MRLINPKVMGVVALLCSSASMAATVNVVSSVATTTASQTFTLTVSGVGFPSTAGGTLGIQFNPAEIDVTGIALAAGSPFTGGIVAEEPFTIMSILGPLVGTLPSGSFDAFVITATALTSGVSLTGANAGLQLVDDQADLCWTDAQTFGCVSPMTYNYTAPVVPVPAAAWLLVSALGGLLGVKRLRRS